MKKKSLICILILTLVTALGTFSYAFGSSVSDKQDELNSINKKKDDVSQDMASLASSIKSQQTEVDKIEASMSEKQEQIEKSEKEIEETKKNIEDRKDGLNNRLRTMYKNGSVGYIDVLLGSNSITEFISNIEMIQRIYKNDQDTLTTLKKQHNILKEKQAALKEEKAALSEQKKSAEEKQAALQADKNKLQAQLDALNAEADRVSGEIAGLQDHDKVYTGGKFMWPTTSSMITSPFGYRKHPITGIYTGHTGVDIGVGSGSPVYAAASGKVIIASWYGGYGYAVVIDHGSGISTLYGHNSSLKVSVGQNVKQGQIVSSSGSTGMSTGPHLHFEVRINGGYVDPMSYFN